MSISTKGISEPVFAFLTYLQAKSGTPPPVSIPPAIIAAAETTDKTLEIGLLHTRITQYVLAAAVAVWAYDYFLTIGDEVSLLWKKGVRTHVKILYFLNRYLPIMELGIATFQGNPLRTAPPSLPACKGTWVTTLFLQAVEGMVAPTIFVIRIYTIYYQNKAMQAVLVSVLCLSNISLLVCLIIVYKGMIAGMMQLPIYNICVSATVPTALAGIYVTPIVVETLIFGATLWHALTFTRNKESFKGTPTAIVLNALYLDGCFYFMILVTARLTTVLVYFLAPQSLNYLTIYFEYSLTSAITARWFLSLRKTVRDGSNPNSVVSPTYAQNVSKTKRTSAIERGAMSFGLRSNVGPKDAIHGLNGLDQQKKPITGIKIETETYMMSDLADDGTDNSVSGPMKPSSTWYDA